MRGGQPDVQRNNTRLDPESGEEKQKRRIAPSGGHSFTERVKADEAVAARRLKEQEKAEDDAAGADVRHDEVKHTGMASFRLFVLEGDQEVSGHRHQLPGHEKKESVVRDEHKGRRQQQRVVECAKHADLRSSVKAPGVAEGIN